MSGTCAYGNGERKELWEGEIKFREEGCSMQQKIYTDAWLRVSYHLCIITLQEND